jgi:putative aminopeptidase FrvX
MRLACSPLLLAIPAALAAQDPFGPGDGLGPFGRAVQSWVALPVAPGREAYAIERIREMGGGEWQAAAHGGISRSRGTGYPHRVVACGLDEPSYVVSHITDDGYLRVHVAGTRATPRHPQWDSWHLGQRVMVLTMDRGSAARVRAVAGVFAVRSVHLGRGRGSATEPTTLEDLWLDVGARNRADVAALGIRVLDPVFRDMPDWSVGDVVVGPYVAARAGCAAVVAAAAAEGAPERGRTTFVVSTQSSFGWTGLRGVLASLGDVDSLIVVHPSALRSTAGSGGGDAAVSFGAANLPTLRSPRVGAVAGLNVRTRFAGTLVEAVAESDLHSFFDGVASAAGVATRADPRRLLVSIAAIRPPQVTDSMSRYAEILSRFADTYAVSGDEAPMRDVLRARLPAWARDSAVADTAGNLILAMGPDRDTIVFVAHMDEIGYQVIRAERGIVTLRPRGGFYGSLFAGQPALLHLDTPTSERAQGCRTLSGSALRGVFLVPDTTARTPEVQAWFGDQLEQAGVVASRPVTGFKCASRLAGTRYTARSIDDRLGSAAMVLALEQITPSRLRHKVIFVWSVREETGLDGARAAAAAFGPSVKRVHAVDTFVSADSPLETGRFAVTPIGAGAVVRALDNSSVAPPEEIERVARVARSAGIPLQIGTTNGGNDGSAFTGEGAVDVPISWPLRYSHSPAELIDLRDLRSLARLVAALAVAPAQ